MTAAVLLVIGDHRIRSILFGQIPYSTAESGQRILLDTQSGLNKNLTTAEIRLIEPVLRILQAYTTSCLDFIVVEQKESNSISLYQHQSNIPIEVGVPMNLTRLANFETIQDAMSEASGIEKVVKNNSCQ